MEVRALLPSPTSCLGDGGCPGPAPLGLTAAAASRLRSALFPRSLCALKPETAAASTRTLRPGAAGRSRSLSRSAPPPPPAPSPTASAGATSRTVSPGRGDRRRGAESAGGPGPGWGRGTELPPSPPQPRPRAPQPHLPHARASLPPSRSPGIPAASAVRPPLFSLQTHLGVLPREMRRYRTSALDRFPSHQKILPPVRPCPFSLLFLGLTSPASPVFPSDMPEKE